MKSVYLNSIESHEYVDNLDIQDTNAEYFDFYSIIQEGLNDITLGNTRPFAEAMADVKVKRAK